MRQDDRTKGKSRYASTAEVGKRRCAEPFPLLSVELSIRQSWCIKRETEGNHNRRRNGRGKNRNQYCHYSTSYPVILHHEASLVRRKDPGERIRGSSRSISRKGR